MEEGTLQGFQELNAEGRQGMGQSFNKLASLSRGGSAAHSPYYDRNLPKMCSFWVRQTCTRVVNGACPFRPCNGQFRFPELASRHPDQLSALVRRLHADGAVSVMRDMSPEMEELRELIKDLQQGSRDQAIRNRYHRLQSIASNGHRRSFDSLDAFDSLAAAPILAMPPVLAAWLPGLAATLFGATALLFSEDG